MNILQILPELNVGGVETGTLDFAQYLVAHKYGSFVVSNGGALVAVLEKQGTRHFSLPVHKKSFLNAKKMVGQLRSIILENNIDIVHARSRVPAWISFFACRKTSAHFITTCHGFYKSLFFSQVMGWSKRVIVPSEMIGKHMIDKFNLRHDRIRKIPRSVDLRKFKMKPLDSHKRVVNPVVMMIGRMTPLKGHRYFLEAMSKVVGQLPRLKVQIIGDAPKNKESYKQELEGLVSRLGLTDNVQFLGNRSDVPELLSKAHVLVFPSVEPESFGRVILEAQSLGVPVVATNVGGVIDIIEDEKTGLLMLPKDPSSMAQKVVRLLKDRKLSAQLTEYAQKKIKQNYTVSKMASKTLEVYKELLEESNILVVKIGALGDVILVTASLRALKKKFPSTKIVCLVGENSRAALLNCPYLDELIIIKERTGFFKWINVWKTSKKLRPYHFDYIIDFQNNRMSHLLSWLSLSKETFGYDNGKWGKLLTKGIKNDCKDIPAVEHQFRILKQLKITYRENAYLELWPSRQNKKYIKDIFAEEWLTDSRYIVGINVAASKKWPTKNWPTEHIAQLCDDLASYNIRVVLTGLATDRNLSNEIRKIAKSKPADLVGRTDIMQLAALIAKCNVFLTPDSAPLHIAAAMRVSTIAFFGPTDSTRHIPPAKDLLVLKKELQCAPCYKTRCSILTHACMQDITPDIVLKNVKELLGIRNG